ncbi:MAG: S1 RNA-binding domain-containing protein [Bacilli bacterium]|nr:S1 RNA-binding domain-containing protein [Bacilli bacterium]MDD4298227.1 S1 RNA-binding domain-containing protein [Bacilli bacterium]MDD4643664.1 S1 RNA-binding domain-containing protein [Bacilli bacterium]
MTKYKKGKIVKGSITGIEKYGIFVNLDNYYSGLIHISEISNNFVKDVNNYVEMGETIYVKVIDVDEDANQVKLSIKDFDYRIKKPGNDVSTIKEVGTGFVALKEKRSVWIDEKLRELT